MSTFDGEKRMKSRTAGKGALMGFIRAYPLQIGIFGVAVLIWLLFLVGAPRAFLSRDIYASFMATTPYFALITIPLTLVVITGEIDLSFPSVMAWGMTGYALVFQATGSVWLGFIACLAAGLLAGLLNGLIVVKIGVPSLVATIGTQFLWRGMVLVLTDGTGSGLSAVQKTILYPGLVARIFGFIPMQFIWTIIVAIVVWFFLNRHRFGAHVYLCGDNVESARLMGVNVDRTKIITFAVVGLAAAFAGFLVSEDVLYFWPTMGDGYLLNTLASVFLGGTSVFGGTGTVFGTFVASFVIGAINAGIVAMGIKAYWTYVIYGLIIVGSAALQILVLKKVK